MENKIKGKKIVFEQKLGNQGFQHDVKQHFELITKTVTHASQISIGNLRPQSKLLKIKKMTKLEKKFVNLYKKII